MLTHMPGLERPDGKGEVPGGLVGASITTATVLPLALNTLNSFVESKARKKEAKMEAQANDMKEKMADMREKGRREAV